MSLRIEPRITIAPRTVAEINAERPIRQDERLKVLREVRKEVARRHEGYGGHTQAEVALRGMLEELDEWIVNTEHYQPSE